MLTIAAAVLSTLFVGASLNAAGWKPRVGTWLVPMVGPAVFGAMIFWYMRRRTARDRIEGLLDEELCPSCRYSLRRLPPEKDGCWVCPECGAAWKMPEHKAATPFQV